MSDYSYKQEGDRYVIYDGDTILTTPAGNNVTTLYKPLADRILKDLNRYGMSFHSADSILAWHFTAIDNFAPMGHARVEQILASSFLRTVDWTCKEQHGAEWKKAFGKWSNRQEQIQEWLSKATIMQMTAACCIGNAYHSINLALTLAIIMEKYAGDERHAAFEALAELIEDNSFYGPKSDMMNDFKTFELYYGIHLDEEGRILDDIIDNDPDEDEEEIDVDDLSEFSVTVEQLIGRNFYHYTDCELDESQPAAYDFSELVLDESDDEDEDDDDEEGDEDAYEDEDENDKSEGLADYLPDDCWVKRFVDDDDPNTFYLLYIVLNEDGKIEYSGCIEETSQQMGGGGFFFMIPGMEMPSVKSYDYNSYPPEKVIDDLRLLFKGRALPLDFSFVGKRLPQAMIDEGGNGGSDTEYTYAIQSAFRLAYMHMSVDTTEDGVVEDFSYSTYQSSGSAYGDMFSRPTCFSDRKDEAMDMLLHIYDMYTDEELEQF